MQSSFGWQATQVKLFLACFLFLDDDKVNLEEKNFTFIIKDLVCVV